MEMFMSIYILLLATTVIFAQSSDTIRYLVPEELPAGHVLGNLLTDSSLSSRLTADELSQLTFSVLPSGGTRSSVVVVETRTGVIRTAERLDREELCPGVEDCVFTVDVATGPAQFFSIIPVQVKVADVNDNPPVFLDDVIKRSISEAAPVGSVISLSPAYDDDLATNGITEYRMDNVNDMFSLVQSRSIDGSLEIHLELLQSLDREVQDSYDVIIIATDGVAPTQHTSTMTTRVHVTDVNDNSPVFTNSTYRIEISENTPVNTVILNVTAHDNDTEHNARLVYSMTERSQTQHGHIFTIDSNTGAVSLQSELDYETTQEYSLFVTVRDNGINPKSAMTSVHVIVKDINDCVPEISVNTLTASGNFEVYENSLAGTFVAHVSVSDGDSAESGEVICSLVVFDTVCDVPDCEVPFKLENLHRSQYKIVTSVELDREHQDQYQLVMRCHDQGQLQLNSSKSLDVHVLDRNDHAPVWQTNRFVIDVQENNIPGEVILHVSVSDDDIGGNADITYGLSGTRSEYLDIDNSGRIKVTNILDHEETDVLLLTLIAHDGTSPDALSSTATLQINVIDINDEVPIFSQKSYFMTVEENKEAHDIGVISAVDHDGSPFNVVEYSLASSTDDAFITVDHQSGVLRTTSPLDREVQDIYHLTITAGNPGYPGLISSVEVTIEVSDVNDNWPVIEEPIDNNHTLTVSTSTEAGDFIYQVLAYDVDIGAAGELTYEVADGDPLDLFHINSTSGIITTQQSMENFDGVSMELIIQVSDRGTSAKLVYTVLIVEISKSTALLTSQQVDSQRNNLLIIICLCGAFAIVTVALIIGIAFLKVRRNQSVTRKSIPIVKETENMLNFPRQGNTIIVPSLGKLTLNCTSKQCKETEQATVKNESMFDSNKKSDGTRNSIVVMNESSHCSMVVPNTSTPVPRAAMTVSPLSVNTRFNMPLNISKTMEMLSDQGLDETELSDSGRGTSEEGDSMKTFSELSPGCCKTLAPTDKHYFTKLPISSLEATNRKLSEYSSDLPAVHNPTNSRHEILYENELNTQRMHQHVTSNLTVDSHNPERRIAGRRQDGVMRHPECERTETVKDSYWPTGISGSVASGVNDTWDDDVTNTTMSGSYVIDSGDLWQYDGQHNVEDIDV